jgi:hypothetical protein
MVLIPAENAGALMVTPAPLVDKFTAPLPTILDVPGTEKLTDCRLPVVVE